MDYIMKRIFIILAVLCLLHVITPGSVLSRNRDFGFGLILGEPSGFSLKYMTTDTVAFDGAMAWSFADETHFHIHADILKHNWNVLREHFGITEGAFPLYYGIGGRIKLEDKSRVGIRFVIGVSYLFDEGPFDAFFELVPVMDIVPATKLNGNAAIGIRYWF